MNNKSMNKNRIICAAFAVIAMGVFADDDSDKWGGEITVWPENPGLFCFVNAQEAVSKSVITNAVSFIADSFMIQTRFVEGDKLCLSAIPTELAKLKAKGAIWIVNDPSLPTTLAAIENGWGVLNVSPIMADNPESARVKSRFQRLVNRLFGTIHGTSDPTMMPACVMKPAVGMNGIDNLPCTSYSPATVSKIGSYLLSAGYKQCRRGFYYDACEEGWAPAPTNDVQRAIWKKIHELPTKPITIQRESERKNK